MLEMIERLRALADGLPVAFGTPGYSKVAGIHDLLSAMEERAATVRAVTAPVGVSSQGAVDRLWERA